MPKAVRLFLQDEIKLTVSTNVPGTPIETRVIRVQNTNINVIDLSKRDDIEAVELSLRIKPGVKYDPKPVTLDKQAQEMQILEETPNNFLSGVPFIGRVFKNKR